MPVILIYFVGLIGHRTIEVHNGLRQLEIFQTGIFRMEQSHCFGCGRRRRSIGKIHHHYGVDIVFKHTARYFALIVEFVGSVRFFEELLAEHSAVSILHQQCGYLLP